MINHAGLHAAFDPAKLNSVAGAKVNIMRFIGALRDLVNLQICATDYKTALC
jgi:hypothetical protein